MADADLVGTGTDGDPSTLAHPYHMEAGAAGVGAAAAVAARQSGHFQGPAPGQVFDHGQYGQSPYPAVASNSGHGHGRSMSGGPGSMGMVDGRPISGVMSSGRQSPFSPTTYEPSSVAGWHPSATSPTTASGVGGAFMAGSNQTSSSPAQAANAKSTQMHVANDEGPVMQHRDGGRVDPESHGSPAPQEVPPSYDSIPQDGPSTSAGARAVEEAARPEKARPFSS